MTATATLTATPRKLRSGDWGAAVQSADVKLGDRVLITTKAGKTWEAEVNQIVWRGPDVTLVATASSRSAHYARGRYGVDTTRRRTRECRSCGCTDPTCVRNGRCTGGPDFDPCFDCA